MTFLSVFNWILTFVLILVSFFMILVVLMQKSKDGGIGAALGGGATEAAFGAETANVLTRATKYSAIVFFTLAFVLYLGRIYERKNSAASGDALPNIVAPAAAGSTSTATPAATSPASAPAVDTPSTTPAPAPAAPKQ